MDISREGESSPERKVEYRIPSELVYKLLETARYGYSVNDNLVARRKLHDIVVALTRFIESSKGNS
jgi:hypothetical protein